MHSTVRREGQGCSRRHIPLGFPAFAAVQAGSSPIDRREPWLRAPLQGEKQSGNWAKARTGLAPLLWAV